jgi:hypothetical protein
MLISARAVVFALAEQDATAEPVRSFLRAAGLDTPEHVASEAIDGLACGMARLRRGHGSAASASKPMRPGALLRYLAWDAGA